MDLLLSVLVVVYHFSLYFWGDNVDNVLPVEIQERI
jgi:hypothetical protein